MLLKIKVGNKTYSASQVSSGISREAMQVNRDALEIAKKGKEVQEAEANQDFDKIQEFLDQALEIKDRKAILVCKAYGDKFTFDDLGELTDAEIDHQVSLITASIGNVIAKK